jgi:hypothetical protein
MEKSARFRVERCFNSYPLDYRVAFAFSPVLYPQARAYGLTTFRMNDRIGLGPLCSPAAYPYRVVSMTGDAAAPVPAALPFWLRPESILSRLQLTTIIESSHMLAMPSTLALCRLMLAARPVPHSSGPPYGQDTLFECFSRLITSPQ